MDDVNNDSMLDREKEYKFFDTYFQHNVKESSYGLIIYASTGVGKTFLVSNYLKEHLDKFRFIPVEVPFLFEMPTQNGFYFERIYRSFCNSFYGKEHASKVDSMRHIKPNGGFSIGIDMIVSVSASTTPENALEKNTDPNIERYKLMLKKLNNKVEKNNPVVFEFQNIQRIDDESYFLLRTFLQNAKNCFAIFEYTVDEINTETKVQRLYQDLKEFFLLDIPYELTWLPLPEVKTIMKHRGHIYSDSELQDIFKKNSGNILAIKLLPQNRVRLGYKSTPINNAIENCHDNVKKFLLILVSLHGGSISTSLLYSLLRSNILMLNHAVLRNENIIEKKLLELKHDNFLSITEDKIYIHDSITEAALELSFTEHGFLAYNLLIDFYLSIQENNEFSLFILLSLYLRYHDEHVYPILHRLKLYLRTHQLSEDLTNKLIELDVTLKETISNKKSFEKIHLILLDIFLSSSKYSAVICLLDNYYDDKNKLHIAYKYASHSEYSSDTTFSNRLEKEIQNYPENSRFVLFLKLCLLSHTMANNIGKKQPTKVMKTILKKEKYKEYPEYYFALKTITFYQKNKDAISNLKTCIDKFNAMNRPDLAIRSKITYCTRLAQNGDIEEARRILKKAKEENDTILSCNSYMFLNNLSAIDLLEKKSD